MTRVLLLIFLAGCATPTTRLEDCAQKCTRLEGKSDSIQWKAETDEHYCSCEVRR